MLRAFSPLVGVQEPEETIVSHFRCRGVEAEDPEGFVRPVGRMIRAFLAIREGDFPAADPRDSLGEREIGFALANFFIRDLLLGHIGRHHEARRASAKGQRAGVDRNKNRRAILAQVPPPAAESRPAFLKIQLLKLRQLLARPDVARRAGQEFLPGVAILRNRRGVDFEKTQRLEVVNPHRRRVRVEQRAILLVRRIRGVFFPQPAASSPFALSVSGQGSVWHRAAQSATGLRC